MISGSPKICSSQHMGWILFRRLTLEPNDNVSQFCACLVCMSSMLSFSDLVDISDITKESNVCVGMCSVALVATMFCCVSGSNIQPVSTVHTCMYKHCTLYNWKCRTDISVETVHTKEVVNGNR